MSSSPSTERSLRVPDSVAMLTLLGDRDANLRAVEQAFPDVLFVARGDEIKVSGPSPEVNSAHDVVSELLELVDRNSTLALDQVSRVVDMVKDGVPSPSGVLSAGIGVGRGRLIRAKTRGQKDYLDAIGENVVVFSVGPAGTGKTYLAMAAAVHALTSGAVTRIVLTRPAVEAGESLGFLPGDLVAKVDPYLRPLYDALYDMLGPEDTHAMLERGTIEIAPLAYMRGRTLSDAFVILDEAQNTSPAQMKMFLTRLGFNSKMVITGDITQVDLPVGRGSGLRHARKVLHNVPGVVFTELDSRDVVRNKIVAAIVDAYGRAEENS
ncbi:MAG: PhoH family protein [Acidimicrobiia bacterium]|nr:PhoH family protein [Acidimicrobiia bacterium]